MKGENTMHKLTDENSRLVRNPEIIAVPPGETIKEQLKDKGLSQKEFAARMDLPEEHISRLISGDMRLTPEIAARLEKALGVPSGFWVNLERIYREKLMKAEEVEIFTKKYDITNVRK